MTQLQKATQMQATKLSLFSNAKYKKQKLKEFNFQVLHKISLLMTHVYFQNF